VKDIRIAAAVTRSPVDDPEGNLSGMVRWVRAARKAGAALICFPELNISGYLNAGPSRSVSEPVPGPISRRLSDIATGERMVVLAGMAETAPGGKVFASHLVARPGGGIEVYRKLHIAPNEREAFAPGTTLPVFSAQGVTFGVQLCYDAHFPELSTRMAEMGADILFMPHASPRGAPADKLVSWMRHLPARAFDNGLFVVACNQTGDNGKGLSFPGVAVVLGPLGKVIDQRVTSAEGLLVVDLKASEFAAVREHPMRFFLPHRRPELYRR